jgi:NADH:ubiquinone oxidoreductase subunit F (NADH-binding)
VEGASCLGRCDRPPAACVAVQGEHHEHYYMGRSLEDLQHFAAQAAKGAALPPSDLDVDHTGLPPNAQINFYGDQPPDYQAIQKAVAARDASLAAARAILQDKYDFSPDQLDQFRLGAIRQLHTDDITDTTVIRAIRCWQMEKDWAKGPELGGWADPLLNELKGGDLRGLGGAGIPAIQKWKDVRDAIRTLRSRDEDDRGFIVVNGDESEPGTFKDRELLLRTPHLIVEGVILAGLLSEATQGFIYIRHEYPEQIAACEAEIRRAEQLGVCGKNASFLGRPFPVSVFVSPGGYICGEQSALIEAMSDRRGEPRNMPPKLETNGLLDLPTLVSNVETYAWAPFIAVKGGATYAACGVNSWQGRRYFSISGDVKRPGVYEVPMGLTLNELIYGEEYCGGMATENYGLKAFAPSGPSGGFLPAVLKAGAGLPRNHTEKKEWQALAARRGFDPASTEMSILHLELELNLFRAISPTQALGAGLVVYDERRDMLEEAVKSLEFFRNESCGKCVPCRTGSQKLTSLGTNVLEGKVAGNAWKAELVPLVKEMSKAIELSSICGLGRSVPMPLRTVIDYFPEDLDRHLT